MMLNKCLQLVFFLIVQTTYLSCGLVFGLLSIHSTKQVFVVYNLKLEFVARV